jgi:hypothetical protein
VTAQANTIPKGEHDGPIQAGAHMSTDSESVTNLNGKAWLSLAVVALAMGFLLFGGAVSLVADLMGPSRPVDLGVPR